MPCTWSADARMHGIGDLCHLRIRHLCRDCQRGPLVGEFLSRRKAYGRAPFVRVAREALGGGHLCVRSKQCNPQGLERFLQYHSSVVWQYAVNRECLLDECALLCSPSRSSDLRDASHRLWSKSEKHTLETTQRSQCQSLQSSRLSSCHYLKLLILLPFKHLDFSTQDVPPDARP